MKKVQHAPLPFMFIKVPDKKMYMKIQAVKNMNKVEIQKFRHVPHSQSCKAGASK